MNKDDLVLLKELLDEKYFLYNQQNFIEEDPIQIPKKFKHKEDIEIAGFLSATIAWGNRKTIIKNAQKWMKLMDNSPYDFVINHKKADLNVFKDFKHRTFNETDAQFFIQSLQNIYLHHGGLEKVFIKGYKKDNSIKMALSGFREIFFEIPTPGRTYKHISNVQKKSAAKRLNMFLRWMVRKDYSGIDFGIWNIPASKLMLPLDIHTGNISRQLGLLTRKQNDWKAVEEITSNLKKMDPDDPIKYDFALFGMGINEK
jgi:uncharacterized protein (TIGR02757 family)